MVAQASESDSNCNSTSQFSVSDKAQLLAVDEPYITNNQDIRYADSGATQHMTFRKDWLINYVLFERDTFSVRLGDGYILHARGRGDVEVKVLTPGVSDPNFIIKDVLYIPNLDKNLLSTTKTAQKGCSVTIQEGGNRIIFVKNNKIILDGSRTNDLLKLNLNPIFTKQCKQAQLNAVCNATLTIWHERMGHLNFKSLRK